MNITTKVHESDAWSKALGITIDIQHCEDKDTFGEAGAYRVIHNNKVVCFGTHNHVFKWLHGAQWLKDAQPAVNNHREEVIEEYCQIQSYLYRSVGNYREANDGFCRKCPSQTQPNWTFHHSGSVPRLLRQIIREWLLKNNYTPREGLFEDATT